MTNVEFDDRTIPDRGRDAVCRVWTIPGEGGGRRGRARRRGGLPRGAQQARLQRGVARPGRAGAVVHPDAAGRTRLQRYAEASRKELEDGVLPLGPLEVAQLDNESESRKRLFRLAPIDGVRFVGDDEAVAGAGLCEELTEFLSGERDGSLGVRVFENFDLGRREASPSPLRPSAKKRARHL